VRTRLELYGLVLAGAAAAWAYAVAAVSGGDADPFVALLAGVVCALVLGRVAASVHPTLTPVAVVALAVVLAWRASDVLSAAPLSGPFGYANAKGAFFLQAAVASLMLAALARTDAAKGLGLIGAIGFGAIPFVVESWTPAVLVLLLPVSVLAARRSLFAKRLVVALTALFLVALALTVMVGSTYSARDRSDVVDRVVDSTVTERRATLWHEALQMLLDHPGKGIGIGAFQVFSLTAQSDRDARWAHNTFLQQGAETGFAGLLLLVAIFVWGFVSLRMAPTIDAVSVLGAVGLASLGIHASIDYILHFPAVPLTAAALVGAAGAARKN
jgi:O-antigen ligase